MTYLDDKNYESALGSFNKAIELSSDTVDYYYNRALVYECLAHQTNNPKEEVAYYSNALNDYEEYLKINPDADFIKNFVQRLKMVLSVIQDKQPEAIVDLRTYPNESILNIAVSRGHLELVETLFKQGLSLSVAAGQFKNTPLLIAAKDERIEIVDWLLKQDSALINDKNFSNWNIIHIAAKMEEYS